MISGTSILLAGALLGLGTYACRVAGPVLNTRFAPSERARVLMSGAAVVLLAALVATTALTEAGGFAGWSRAAGVLVAGALAWRRAPFVVVVVAAAATTACLRLLGVP